MLLLKAEVKKYIGTTQNELMKLNVTISNEK
jgi:hypothetical protein